MQISESQVDRDSLEQFAQEVALLIQHGNFVTLADRFGYAPAYGRQLASAIEDDLSDKSRLQGHESVRAQIPYIDIKYFKSDASQSTGLVAAIDCAAYLAGDAAVEFSLVVTCRGSDRYITLESIDRV